jgi:hypothetical protein
LILWEGIQGKPVPFENGLYSLMGLEDKTYRVTIRAEGFGEVEKNLQAKKGELKQIDLTLLPTTSSRSASPPQSKGAPRTKP